MFHSGTKYYIKLAQAVLASCCLLLAAAALSTRVHLAHLPQTPATGGARLNQRFRPNVALFARYGNAASSNAAAAADEGASQGATRLRFKPDGTFKILQFTDLHLGEDQAKDNATLQVRAGRTVV